jgi:BirA family biotin operon repressor/biotin-[acetyl-CoA-carboxylase] ligase
LMTLDAVDAGILEVLRARPGEFAGWDELGRPTGLAASDLASRVARLRTCGYGIEERPGLGVRLLEEPRPLDGEEIRALLPGGLAAEVSVFGAATSTNDLARRMVRERAGQALLILAETQTAGKGRQNRAWFSPPGVGLWLSLALWPKLDAAAVSSIGLVAAVAVAAAVRRAAGLEARVKWPNDVWIEERKVCGILSEMEEVGGRRCAIVGIGINVNQREVDFPPELTGIAGSLRMFADSTVDRIVVLKAVLDELDRRIPQFDAEGFAPFQTEWEELSFMQGRRVRISSMEDTIEGTVLGITGTGALRVVDRANTTHEVLSGDVEFID